MSLLSFPVRLFHNKGCKGHQSFNFLLNAVTFLIRRNGQTLYVDKESATPVSHGQQTARQTLK